MTEHMSLRRFAMIVCASILALPVVLGAQSGIAGTWETKDDLLPHAPYLLVLKTDQAKVTGSLTQSGATVPISEGVLKGDVLTFKVASPGGGDRTITFTGKVKGDVITFSREATVRQGGPEGGNGIFGMKGVKTFEVHRRKA